MKKIFGLGILMGLLFGVNSVLFAQDGQNPPPPQGGQKRMGRPEGSPEGPGRMMRGGMRGERGDKGGRGEMGGGPRGGMRGGGFGISDEELFKLNLTNDQIVKLYNFKKKMSEQKETMMKDHKMGGEGMAKPADGMNPQDMRQLMSAKQLGTLTADQKSKLDAMEANRKQMMEKRKTEMEAMKTKMEATHQEFLNIFTLDQRKQLETMRADRAKQMQDKMQERRKDGQGGGMRRGQKPTTPPAKPE